MEEDVEEKQRLAKVLSERDNSIRVLRALAAEKEEKAKQAMIAGVESLASLLQEKTSAEEQTPKSSDQEGDSTEKAATRPKKIVSAAQPAADYGGRSVESLRSLEKARDATLGFLLKRIDKAEADLAAIKNPSEPPISKEPF